MTKTTPHFQKGLALIELVIALALSAVLMLGVTRMFSDSITNSSSETALAQVQDSARTAMEIIKRDVRMAGFQGNAPGAISPVDNSLVDLSQQAVSIVTNANALISDELRVQKAYEIRRSENLADPNADISPVRVTQFFDTANGNRLILDRAICYDAADIFLVTDGQKVATFQINEIAPCIIGNSGSSTQQATPIGTAGNSVALGEFALPESCSAASPDNCPLLYQLGGLNGSSYTVANNANGIPALFRDGTELVQGVENLQVMLGITNAAGDRTLYAESCAAIPAADCNITHIQLSMVVSSGFDVLPQNTQQRYRIINPNAATSTLVTNDRRLRRVFTSTIKLRNRG